MVILSYFVWQKYKIFCCRNVFLDFDGWGHVSALEQNFNPSPTDIKRRNDQGNFLGHHCKPNNMLIFLHFL